MTLNVWVRVFISLVWVSVGLGYLAPSFRTSQPLVRNKKSMWASTSFHDSTFVQNSVRERVVDESEKASITLPELTSEDLDNLLRGERVQKQDRSKSHGEGLVVVDVNASPEIIFSHLSRFDAYQSMIPTVRKVEVLTITPRGTEAEFSLSKFMLKVNVLHTVNKKERTIKFALNPNRVNPVFSRAAGFWHVEAPTDRPNGYSRVYLSASISVSRFVPPFLLDYAASKALPRASTWIRPYFEEGLMEWS